MKWFGIALLGLSAALWAIKATAQTGYVVVECDQRGYCLPLSERGHQAQVFVTITQCRVHMAGMTASRPPGALDCVPVGKGKR